MLRPSDASAFDNGGATVGEVDAGPFVLDGVVVANFEDAGAAGGLVRSDAGAAGGLVRSAALETVPDPVPVPAAVPAVAP